MNHDIDTRSGRLLTLDQAAERIRAGHFLCVAGDEAQLRRLPTGNWIGGTIPYFMGQDGGVSCRERLFVNVIETSATPPRIVSHDPDSISRICTEAPEHGYSLLVLPAFSAVHSAYARNAPDFDEMFLRPLVGWVSGVHLEDLSTSTPLTVNGLNGEFAHDRAVVMHVPLPPELIARVGIVNRYVQGRGAVIRFPRTGFSARECLVDGVPMDLCDYLDSSGADMRRPLVANQLGAMINVSLKGIDADTRRVDFYAPVFDDVEYRLAAPDPDTEATDLAVDGASLVFSCNCILNFLYDGLEGRSTGPFTGPMTFGEIAFLLLNQTLVYLSIEPA